MKQGNEEVKFVKEPEEETQNYIFQKNKKTKVGVFVFITILLFLIIGVITSVTYFTSEAL
ncbi:hypothetical protein HZY62_08030 [Maribacter polysiphoniae]|uniref:Uncharacterized protein n=1 Tax=Maribacter polysiphoniae TaxID=429344 RepID=A0A316E1T1_9FLAO|nr:hypothetical protein [Maribacter polysiphoniae]MBD1260534.1 hypothetical protein [Maribacter polysiphoniae]PWK24341.1 hypothetical protein LX92_01931 [Maribacter polysiphoniae]